MAHHKSTIKRIRKSRNERAYNRQYKTRMRTMIKNFLNLSDKEEADSHYRRTVSLLDKLASKGVIHRNKAANQKERITRHLNSLA